MDIIGNLDGAFYQIAEFVIITFLGMYLIFALVVIRQINLMTKTVQVGFEKFLKLIGVLHITFALFVFIASIIVFLFP